MTAETVRDALLNLAPFVTVEHDQVLPEFLCQVAEDCIDLATCEATWSRPDETAGHVDHACLAHITAWVRDHVIGTGADRVTVKIGATL